MAPTVLRRLLVRRGSARPARRDARRSGHGLSRAARVPRVGERPRLGVPSGFLDRLAPTPPGASGGFHELVPAGRSLCVSIAPEEPRLHRGRGRDARPRHRRQRRSHECRTRRALEAASLRRRGSDRVHLEPVGRLSQDLGRPRGVSFLPRYDSRASTTSPSMRGTAETSRKTSPSAWASRG